MLSSIMYLYRVRLNYPYTAKFGYRSIILTHTLLEVFLNVSGPVSGRRRRPQNKHYYIHVLKSVDIHRRLWNLTLPCCIYPRIIMSTYCIFSHDFWLFISPAIFRGHFENTVYISRKLKKTVLQRSGWAALMIVVGREPFEIRLPPEGGRS